MASDDLIIGSAIDDLFAGEQLDSNPAAASAVVINPDGGPGQPGGNDTILGLDGWDSLAGEALAYGGSLAGALATNLASLGGAAGDDSLNGGGARDSIGR